MVFFFMLKVVAIVIGIDVLKRISIGYSGMLTPCQLGKVVIDDVEWIMIAFIMVSVLY